MTPSKILQYRWSDSWIEAPEADSFWSQLEQYQAQLRSSQSYDVWLVERNPVRFLAAFLAAAQIPCRVWLVNSCWGQREWAQVISQCRPDQVIGSLPDGVFDAGGRYPMGTRHIPSPQWDLETQILIPTGGSSGNIRFATHTWETLAASVQGFQQHFQVDTVNAYCVLPLYHVSGLMQAMRCLLSGGRLVIQPFRELLQEGAITVSLHNLFISLVPTQLQRLLMGDWNAVPWLRRFSAILLGGGAPWSNLMSQAQELYLPLAPTYGMTETASQVATLLPQEFLLGQTGSGRALPHASLTVRDAAGGSLPPNQVGQIMVETLSLALADGLTPLSQPFQTGDLGYLDASGYLHVMGRETSLIITGGEKVLPEEVESAILATGLVQDVAVLGLPDEEWGERVVAIMVMGVEARSGDYLHQALKSHLSPYKIPKRWLMRAQLPRNAQGKLNRAALRQWAMAQG